MFGSFGIMELVLILFIVLIIFGAGKLPQLGEGVGKAIKGFKKSVHEADEIAAEPTAPQPTIPPRSEAASQTTIDAPAEPPGNGLQPPHT
ncbi:twin-arginine translocase TatA/TatE family subunit [Nitrospira lenta]|uniref:Sec-independent protein translocase protein TatA n=1 Tax=Nitrospira lenta TaxID=1436998 RepID=A0A330L7E8_9BACT|nr:twin-arginine translocase TatA/TatE family subunit [Nitrospira lenta]SPP65257.1 Sec-independent protein translocase protein TatA [Nitrospira lenta]